MADEIQLDFENQMFVELLAEDGMVVLARYESQICNKRLIIIWHVSYYTRHN